MATKDRLLNLCAACSTRKMIRSDPERAHPSRHAALHGLDRFAQPLWQVASTGLQGKLWPHRKAQGCILASEATLAFLSRRPLCTFLGTWGQGARQHQRLALEAKPCQATVPPPGEAEGSAGLKPTRRVP